MVLKICYVEGINLIISYIFDKKICWYSILCSCYIVVRIFMELIGYVG